MVTRQEFAQAVAESIAESWRTSVLPPLMFAVGQMAGEIRAARVRQMAEAVIDPTAAQIGGLECSRPDCRQQSVTLTATPASHPQIDYWTTRRCATCGATDGPVPMAAALLAQVGGIQGGTKPAKATEAAMVEHRRRLAGV